MTAPLFRYNKIVKFATNYEDDSDDLTGWRYYLLWKVENQGLILFPLTSNHNHRDIIFVSQYKITIPRPPCLQSKIYPRTFVNANRLVIVPPEAFSYLRFCNSCPAFCLAEDDFQRIINLHQNLTKYRIRIKRIDLTSKDFLINV